VRPSPGLAIWRKCEPLKAEMILTTGAAKVRAVFANKNLALFLNQFHQHDTAVQSARGNLTLAIDRYRLGIARTSI
jgi:hypothetical protein